MLYVFRWMKIGQTKKYSVKPRIVRIAIALLIGLAILAIHPFQGSAAENQPDACSIDAFCASMVEVQLSRTVPQLKTLDITLVHTGPGPNYLSYGILPAGYISRVSAISEDGEWWAIALPFDIALDGIGWVSDAAVNVHNIEELPDWLKNCIPTNYCDYLRLHNPQYISIRQPSANAPMFGIIPPYTFFR